MIRGQNDGRACSFCPLSPVLCPPTCYSAASGRGAAIGAGRLSVTMFPGRESVESWRSDFVAQRDGVRVPFAADNPAGIDYILQYVTTAELIKLPRTPTVYQALLSRDQIVHDIRHEALMGLVKLNGTDMLTELLAAHGGRRSHPAPRRRRRASRACIPGAGNEFPVGMDRAARAALRSSRPSARWPVYPQTCGRRDFRERGRGKTTSNAGRVSRSGCPGCG